MKKIYKVLIALICVVMVMCVVKAAVSAEDEITTTVETNTVETESLPIETETATEGENSATGITVPTTDEIVKWVETHLEEISVIVTLIATLIYQVRKHSSLNKSIATCNNNAVAVVENSNNAIATALTEVMAVSTVVGAYKDQVDTLLSEIRQNDDEKKRLQTALTEVENYLKTAKLANVELSNEVAELLVLANIPNSKKEELYARHRAAVAAIDAADHNNTEVKEDVGEEA